MLKTYIAGVRPEHRQAYIDAHRTPNSDLMRRYKEAGMRHCSVYLLCDTLVMLVEAEDHDALAEAMSKDPVDIEWQDHVRPMKSEGDWQEMQSIFRVDL